MCESSAKCASLSWLLTLCVSLAVCVPALLHYMSVLLCSTICLCMLLCIKDLKDFMRQAGDITYADAHKQRVGEG